MSYGILPTIQKAGKVGRPNAFPPPWSHAAFAAGSVAQLADHLRISSRTLERWVRKPPRSTIIRLAVSAWFRDNELPEPW